MFSLQFHNIFVADTICASWRFARPSGTRCTALVHGIIAKKFERRHLHCPIFVHVPGTCDRLRWIIFIVTEHIRYCDQRLVSNHARRCCRHTKVDTVHEFAGILQCRRSGGTRSYQTAITRFYVPRIHCASTWTGTATGKSAQTISPHSLTIHAYASKFRCCSSPHLQKSVSFTRVLLSFAWALSSSKTLNELLPTSLLNFFDYSDYFRFFISYFFFFTTFNFLIWRDLRILILIF